MIPDNMKNYLQRLKDSSNVKVTDIAITNIKPNQNIPNSKNKFPGPTGVCANAVKPTPYVKKFQTGPGQKSQLEVSSYTLPKRRYPPPTVPPNIQLNHQLPSPGQKDSEIPIKQSPKSIPNIKNTERDNKHIKKKKVSLDSNKISSAPHKKESKPKNSYPTPTPISKRNRNRGRGKTRHFSSSVSSENKVLNKCYKNTKYSYDYKRRKINEKRNPKKNTTHYTEFRGCNKASLKASSSKHDKIRFTVPEIVKLHTEVDAKTTDAPAQHTRKKVIVNMDECNDFSTFWDVPLCDVIFVSYADEAKRSKSSGLHAKNVITQYKVTKMDPKAKPKEAEAIQKVESIDGCQEVKKNESEKNEVSINGMSQTLSDLMVKFDEAMRKIERDLKPETPEYIEYVLFEDDNHLEEPAQLLFSKIMFLKIIPVMDMFASDYNIENVLSYLSSIDLTGHRSFVVKELVVWALETRELYMIYFGHVLLWLIAGGLIRRAEVVHGLSQCFIHMNDKYPNYSKDVSRFITCVIPMLLSNYLELSDFMYIIKSRSESMLLDCIMRLFDILAEMTCFRTLRDVYMNPEMKLEFKFKIMEKYPSLKAIPKIPSLYISFDIRTIFKFNINGDLYPSQFDSEAIYKDYMKEFFNLLHFTCPMSPYKAVELHIANVVDENVDFLRCLLNSYRRLLMFYTFMDIILSRRCHLPRHFARFLTAALVKNNLCLSSLPESIMLDTNFDEVPLIVYTELP